MTSKKYRQTLLVPVLFAAIVSASGCSTIPVEPPICAPLRPTLESIEVAEQRAILAIDPELLRRLAENDAKLKSHIVVLERMIFSHDEPLGGC